MTLIVKGHPLPQQRGAVLRAGKEIGRPPTRGFQKRLRWRPHQSPPFVARRDWCADYIQSVDAKQEGAVDW